MAKRLQIILPDLEYREIQRMARSRQISVAEWVRQALEQSRSHESLGDFDKKLAAIRTAAQYEFPVGDIATMLAEIEKS